MKLAYNTWSMATVPYDMFIPELADIGYRALAISVVPGYTIAGSWAPNAGDMDRLTADDRRRLRALLQERGLELASVVGNQRLIGDTELVQRSLERLRRTIDLCVELTPNGQEPPTMNTGAGGAPRDFSEHADALAQRLGGLAEYASQRGVVVCLEPHVAAAIDTVERAEWIVRAVSHPSFKLDFDVSHFEVVGVPTHLSVSRLLPISGAVEMKDQHFRYVGAVAADASWLVQGNGSGRACAPDGREVEYQFLLGGEGTFDLPAYVRLMYAGGFTKPIAFEASVQCQARPDYDPLATARSVYEWMQAGWRAAGVPFD